jgi:hypothetical protein
LRAQSSSDQVANYRSATAEQVVDLESLDEPGRTERERAGSLARALTPVAIRVWTKDGPSHVYLRNDNAWRYALQAAKSSITV